MNVDSHDSSNPYNAAYTLTYGLLALFGGVGGLIVAHRWGGFKSLIGRALSAFALGLLAQEFGQLVYNYHIYVLDTEPYPSLGDVGFFGSVLFYIYGIWLLAQAAGLRVALKSHRNKLLLIVIPLIFLSISFSVFLREYEFDWSNPLTIFLDFGYPVFQTLYVSIAALTFIVSRKYLGGVMRPAILMLAGALTLQYICDFTFLYQVSHEAWYAGGWNDYLYTLSYAVMGLSLLRFGTVFSEIRKIDR
ncbi:MAG TPA: hypothetical protein VF272_04465 [Candidatus Saccharimonadia bacterium]